MIYLFYFAAAFGLAYIVGHSAISVGFRRWLGGTPLRMVGSGADAKWEPAKPGALGPFGDFICSLVECPACFGFWIGLAGSFILEPLLTPFLLWCFITACATSGVNFILARATRLS
jgi:hypothetical protein